MHIMSFVILFALIPLLNPPLTITDWPASFLIAAGTLNFFAFVFLYRAFHRGVVSLVAPVAYSYPVVTTVVAVALLGVALAATRALAIAGIIAGLLLLSTRFSEIKMYMKGDGLPKLTAGVGWAGASALSFGMVYVAVGYATPLVGYFLPVLFLRGVGSAIGLVFAPAFHANIRPSRVSFSPTIIAMGFLESVGFLTFNFGVSLGADSLPVVAALSGMGGAVAAAYALVFLRERLEKNQLIGALLSFAGIFTLLFLEG